MKVLMISGDATILNSNVPAGKRTEEYRNVLGELDILLCYGSVFSFISGVFKGCNLMRRKDFDVITAQSPEHWALAWLLSSFFHVPWHMQVHTDILSPFFKKESFKNKLRVLFFKFLLPRADGVRVVSERIKKSILAHNRLLINELAVLPIYVDSGRIKDFIPKMDLRKKYPDYNFIILMASRLTCEKNIGLAFEAMAEFKKNNSRALLLIVGDGPEKENLKFKVSEFKLNNNVIFESWTDDLISYYKTADVFLLTSDYEGYGMSLVEAAFAGCKIISSDVGIASEILEPENIFRVNDKNDLVSKLENAIQGKIKSPKPISTQTKEDYLRLYRNSLEKCTKK